MKPYHLCCIFSAMCCLSADTLQPFGARASLAFEPNRGQFEGAKGAFLTRAQGFSTVLDGAEATYFLNGAKLKMHWLGGSHTKAVSGDVLPGTANYYAGSDRTRWISGIPTYASVRMPSVYPGIDVVYYGSAQQLEYDLVVAPHTDISRVALAFEAGRMHLDAKGNLIVRIGAGEFVQHKPVAYQIRAGKRIPVEVRYIVDKGTVRFAVGRYNRNEALVIDPTIAWGVALASRGTLNQANAIAVDSAGNVFVAGSTDATNFPVSAGAFQSANHGTSAFLTKFDSSGTVVFSTYFGGTLNSAAKAVAVDTSGNAYVAGETSAADLPTMSAYQAALRGTQDAFVAKFSPAGGFLYGTYLGGSKNETMGGIAVDASGNMYVAGSTNSPDFPTASAYQSTLYQTSSGTSTVAYVTKISAAGSSLIFSTYLGGTNFDAAAAVALGPGGSVYITGSAYSYDFPTTAGAFQTAPVNVPSAFVARLASNGASLIYSTYLGGTRTGTPAVAPRAQGTAVDVDASGFAYVTGSTNDSSFPVKSAVQGTLPTQTPSSGSSAFVTRMSPDGASLAYSTYLGGSNQDLAFGVRVNASGNASVVGNSASRDLPTVAAFRPQGDARDAFVTTLNPTGDTILFSSYLGGSGLDWAFGVAVDSSDNLYVAGATTSSDFPPAHPGVDGSPSPFVVKLSGPTASIPVTFTTSPAGLQVTVDGAIFATPKTFLWAPGVTHTLDAPTPQYPSGSPGNAFQSWSQGGDRSQSLVTPTAATTYTANFDSPACTYTLGTPTPATFGQAGGSGTVPIITQGTCAWTVTTSAPWITSSVQSSLASGNIPFTVAPNPAGGTRTGTIMAGSATATITQTFVPPAVTDLGPYCAGNGIACGSTATLSFTVADGDGSSELTVSNMLINSSLDGRQACYLAFDHVGKVLYIVNDAGTAISTGMTFNSAGQGVGLLSNSQCTVDGSKTSVSTPIGQTTATLTIGLSFASAFHGNKVIYLAARDKEGLNSGWLARGTLAVPGGATAYPNVVSAGNVGTGPMGAYVGAIYQDATSNTNLSPSQILINTSLDGRNACYVGYDHTNNRLFLVNDAGDALLPGIQLGTSATTQNSQCRIDGLNSGYELNGQSYTLYLTIHFLPGFEGWKIVYAATQTVQGGNSGWQAAGSIFAAIN